MTDPALPITPPLPDATPLRRDHRAHRGGRGWAAAGLAALLGLALLAVLAHERMSQSALLALETRGTNTLKLAVAALDGQLQRFAPLPHLLAQQAAVQDLLAQRESPARIQRANRFLEETAQLLGASDIYVMGLDGTTIAASNHNLARNFIGGNFAFRPYFLDALGTTSRVRGFYFGAPINQNGAQVGVLALKLNLDTLEDSWRGSDYEVLVTDPEGIVFMSSHPDLSFAATLPLTPDRLSRTRSTRRYAETELHEVPLRVAQDVGHALWQFHQTGLAREYLVVSEHMPNADWTVQVLVNTEGARRAVLTQMVLMGLVLGLAGLGIVIVAQRRARLRERMALQDEAQTQLERRVEERTAELAAVNRQLEDEVIERTHAEERLRATQADLVQAGKLAALGQMSAALGHEFNQPLGAARNFAENAQTLIDRGRLEEAKGNVERILGLIGKMGDLSKHLRNFARKPNTQLSDVSLPDEISAVREILGWRFRDEAITLSVDVPALRVRAGSVRLQQVLVNILTNAMDAMSGCSDRRIEIRAQVSDGWVDLTIADTGPGIARQLIERVFDPFFSTKGVGKGLGLGLSISYNILHDFGGSLAVRNAKEGEYPGGAVFTLRLPRAEGVSE